MNRLGSARALEQRAAERRLDHLVARAVHHQHRRADVGDALAGVEALRDQRAQRQPAEAQRGVHIGDRRERAFDDHAGLVVNLGREVHRDGAAQRMAVDQPRPHRMALAQPLPRRARVLVRHRLRRQRLAAATEAAVVDPQHRHAQRMQAAHAKRTAQHVPACAVQVQHHRRVGALVGQPQRVQLHRLRRTGRREVDPVVLQAIGRRAVPALLGGLKDPAALLLVQCGAARAQQAGRHRGNPDSTPVSRGHGRYNSISGRA